MTKRQEKKSESIEIRLPYSQKNAFMDACREQGISASEALRHYIETALEPEPKSPKQYFSFGAIFNMLEHHRRKLTAGVAATFGVATLAFALPSTAGEELFMSFDRNGDGVLTEGEISANDSKVFAMLDKDKSGTITASEFEREGELTSITDNIVGGKGTNEPEKRIITVETTKFSIGDDGKANVYVNQWGNSVPIDATDSDIRNIVENMKTEMASAVTLEAMTDTETYARLAELEARDEVSKLHTVVRLKKLENLEETLAELSGINIEIDLDNLSSLKELEKLSKLSALEGLAGLEGLKELEQLDALGDMDFDFDFDFDFSELETRLEGLDIELEELQEAIESKIEGKIEIKIAELEDKLEGESKVIVIKKKGDVSVIHTDEKDQTSVE